MNRSVVGWVAIMSLTLALGGSWVAPVSAADKPPKNEALENDMDKMAKAFRKLPGQLKDPTQNAASLALLVDMETACLAAKEEVPPMAATIPEEKRDKFISDYRGALIGLMRQLLDLEQLVIDGKNDKAPEAITAIRDSMKAGHMEFRLPEKDGG